MIAYRATPRHDPSHTYIHKVHTYVIHIFPMLVPTYSAPLASEKPHTEFIFAMRRTVRCLTIFDDDLQEATKAEVVNALRAIRRKCCWKGNMGRECARLTFNRQQEKRDGGRVARKAQRDSNIWPSHLYVHEMLREILMRRPSRAVRQSRK